MIIYTRIVEVLGLEVDCKFYVNFIVFIYHKITCYEVEGLHVLNGIATPWIPEVSAIFCAKFSLPSFLPCPSNSSRCSFAICLTLVLACLVSNISLKFTVFFYLLQYLMIFMSMSCIACEMISVILCNLLWASCLVASRFSCFTVNVLKDFRIMAVTREKSRLLQINAIPTGRPTPLAKTAIETL